MCHNNVSYHTIIDCVKFKTINYKLPNIDTLYENNKIINNTEYFTNLSHFIKWKIYHENIVLYDFGWINYNSNENILNDNSNVNEINLGFENQSLFNFLEQQGYYITNEKITFSIQIKDENGIVTNEVKKHNFYK